MQINRAYKTELKPNNDQRTTLFRHAGTARFAYNWGIERKREILTLNRKLAEDRALSGCDDTEVNAALDNMPEVHFNVPNAIELHRELNSLKKTGLAWMYEVSKCAPQEALRNLDSAFARFFDGDADFPKFKSRKHDAGSFRLTGTINVSGSAIQLPRIGTVRLKESGCLPADAHILSATISEQSGRWFVSLSVIEEHTVPENSGSICGVDLGVKSLATVSDGTVFENPESLSTYIRKLKRQQREVSRKVIGSNSRRKAVHRLNRTHLKISNMRKDAIHKATTWLAKNKSAIVIEDLNVSGMVRNHHLAAAISDASFGQFRRQPEYKAGWYSSRIVLADRFYPSSRTCSACGHVKQGLKLSERIFECEMCNSKIDRDLNAAINLSGLAASSAESLNACLRLEVAELLAQCPPVIQEMNTISLGMSG